MPPARLTACECNRIQARHGVRRGDGGRRGVLHVPVQVRALSKSLFKPIEALTDPIETSLSSLLSSLCSWKRVPSCRPVYEESPFESIPAACWWCIVTMTTVGYGDMYPTGWIGKLLGCVVMMFGILVIALPITVIGSNFAVVYKVRRFSHPPPPY